ncbi:Phospholipid scramblase 1, partial [Cichlidogyrus casuarinus]
DFLLHQGIHLHQGFQLHKDILLDSRVLLSKPLNRLDILLLLSQVKLRITTHSDASDLDGVQVDAPPGSACGRVQQIPGNCGGRFEIQYPQGGVVCYCFSENNQCCNCSIEQRFDVVDGTTKIGEIVKEYSDYFQERYTRASNYRIKFPKDLKVEAKATIIGAAILIDYMHFDDQPRNDEDNKNPVAMPLIPGAHQPGYGYGQYQAGPMMSGQGHSMF